MTEVVAGARWLLSGLYPDVRTGDAAGSALLFNMEKLFETVLGLRIRHACQMQGGGRLSVGLQGPMRNLATSGFQLRPDSPFRAETRASPSSMQNGSASISASRTRALRVGTLIR